MSAAGHLSRARAGSHTSGKMSRGRTGHMGDFAVAPSPSPPLPGRYFEPCAATASMLLYAQGNSVVCAHHDTLTIERRFARHSEEVQLLAVDNVSDVGAGRLVVSYDAGQTAIVWDLLTGDEVARFASYENLTCASWMRNGNVAFGNIQGNVILFEPTTSEHISARTIDQIAITAIAPGADCRTFAIGYQNGSLLIATLQPRFTILHNLTTSRGPSPIVTLAWHASSSRQKSDMLAVQTNDGDLRVWSVSKAYNSDDPAKVVRLLKRTENYVPGPNWMGWSKNGRIIQYSEGETISWDVRTKHVTYDTIPTSDSLRGLAVYGPGASLFTLGPNNMVQQFDLNAPAMMVAEAQHRAGLLPPSPPISLEADDKGAQASQSESESSVQISIHADIISEDDERGMSPLARLVQGDHGSDIDRYRTASPASSAHSQSSVSISSSSSQTPANRYAGSSTSRGLTENTYISTGSSLRSGHPAGQRESFSTASSVSMGSSHYRSRHRPSRLRHEVPRSPEAAAVTDLFKFTKSRLNDVPYKTPFANESVRLTNDDLRRQMLSTIFGWNKDVDELIRDEMARHPLGSTNRILLAKWLGDINTDIMAMGSENMTSSDWMLLALSGIGGQASQHGLGRAYVQRLLENGDVHAAATIMIGMGDHNDAVEIYVSHKKFMEALILTCLFFPSVWERQVGILRKWGEWAVQHGQQQLAIRCFACTGRESSEPWSSPSANQINFPSIGQTVSELASPPMSPPALTHGPQRSVAKASALKLITSFDKPANKLLAQVDDGMTPLAAAATPLLDSAAGSADPATAVIRGGRSQFASPMSARPGAQPFGRNRLPSIGEAPDLGHRELLTAVTRPPGDPYANININPIITDQSLGSGRSLDLLRPQTSSPRLVKDAPQPPPSPSPAAALALMEGPGQRNGSRARKPDGLELSVPAGGDGVGGDITSPEPSATSSTRYHWPRRRGPASVTSSVTSASAASSVAGRSHRGRRREEQNHGKSLDDYLTGVNATKAGKRHASSRDGHHRGRDSSHGTTERGRGDSRGYTPKGGKRSPKSPVPMSPEDLINLATPKEDIGFEEKQGEDGQPSTVRKTTSTRDAFAKPRSRNASRSGRGTSRDGRRGQSTERHIPPPLDLRGRSATREKASNRSPSSPQPMAAEPDYASSGEEDYKLALEAQERFRQKQIRSTSRGGKDGLASPSIARSNSGWGSRQKRVPTPLSTPGPASNLSALETKDERQLKKAAAARELEERRRSLALRAHGEVSPGHSATPGPLMELPSTTYVPMRREDLPSRSATADPTQQRERSLYAGRDGLRMGLPATPKAMRLVVDSDSSKHGVPVPAVPSAYAQQNSPPGTQSNRSSPRKSGPEAESAEAPILLLPSTVYTPPPSRQAVGAGIARSMSAPPRDLVMPSGPNSARHTFNKPSLSISTGRRPSHDGQMPPPPPPPPAPPVLKELQHLAMPPPPPPAPLPHAAAGPKPVVYGGSTGMIEIVMDDDQPQPAPAPTVTPVSENTVPVIAPPVPTSSRASHHRGRSSVDNSIGARFTRATERMRSASRSRTARDPTSRIKSPDIAPYESIPPPPPPPAMSYQMRAEMAKSPGPAVYNRDDFRTGLHRSEMI